VSQNATPGNRTNEEVIETMQRTLYYRCQACSPDQSLTVVGPIKTTLLSVAQAYDICVADHGRRFPSCRLTYTPYVAVDFLIRQVQ